MPENLWSAGIGNLLIARRTPEGKLACAVFLVHAHRGNYTVPLKPSEATPEIAAPAEADDENDDLHDQAKEEKASWRRRLPGR